ncbi:MAG: hypothetical protein H6626_00750 [Pseudobdellovibrionaceae bacterium]|nr:hypothetical protein [Bdellovibrionales bacterium]USN47652.1 MAG: hypothetical protein H6626_00750 [Pseudobdellovibrionaceae bacterium]
MLASKRLVTIFSLISVGFASPLWAATEESSASESKVKIEDVKKEKNDIDSEITNARMRAESGSKDKLSVSTSLGFSMGSVEDPFGATRPDIYGNPENDERPEIGGDLGVRYRFNKNDSMTVGVGFGILTPLQGDIDGDPNKSQAQLSNPNIGYSRVYKLGEFQTVSSADLTIATTQKWKENKMAAGTSLGQNMLTTFADNKLTLGTSVDFTYYFYEDGVQAPTAKGVDNRSAYRMGIYPYAEYAFTDKYSLRTVFGYMNFRHKRGRTDKSLLNMDKTPSYQSIGLGMAVTRDVYLYPNVQFLPEDLATDKTNVAISATINL